jgi:hypothetical protein
VREYFPPRALRPAPEGEKKAIAWWHFSLTSVLGTIYLEEGYERKITDKID